MRGSIVTHVRSIRRRRLDLDLGRSLFVSLAHRRGLPWCRVVPMTTDVVAVLVVVVVVVVVVVGILLVSLVTSIPLKLLVCLDNFAEFRLLFLGFFLPSLSMNQTCVSPMVTTDEVTPHTTYEILTTPPKTTRSIVTGVCANQKNCPMNVFY